MPPTPKRVIATLLTLIATPLATARQHVTDGAFDDWSLPQAMVSDPVGDAGGAFDVRSLWASSEGTTLHLRLELAQPLNLQSGAGSDGTLRIDVEVNGRTLTLDLRARTASVNGQPVPWTELGHFQPTHASTLFEGQLNLLAAGATSDSGVRVRLSGSDSLTQDLVLRLDRPMPAVERGNLDRPATSHVRLANLNTLNNGMLDAQRGPALLRLLAAAQPDVICLQEDYSATWQQISQRLAASMPLPAGQSWWVLKNGTQGRTLAVRGTVIPAPHRDNAFVAGLARMECGDVFVICLHAKCCGHAGSSEDGRRIEQMQAVATLVGDLRQGRLGSALAPHAGAPVLLAGDWNLVGSRVPLDIVEDPDGPAMQAVLPRSVIGSDVFTWRDSDSPFWPGRLDLIACDRSLRPLKAVVLDTARLDPGDRESAGVLAEDSAASDHLMLVADFVLAGDCPHDLDGNLAVDAGDLGVLLIRFGEGMESGLDLDGSGRVDAGDIGTLLTSFGPCA
ncbi:MAG: hypothetical protein RLZZ558_1842 [Planctomycetota bacterium]|jgi:endonuclease/exonuclease/phosphatase family metal-dependent hydrolase